MFKIAGIVLARMDSRRLPGKALLQLGGQTLIERCLRGVLRSGYFYPILATTNRLVDQPLVEFAKQMGVPCFQGEQNNVYQRVCDCLRHFDVDIFARINGDSPFVQAGLLDVGLDLLVRENCDFVSNLVPRRFPYGVSVEILRSEKFLRNQKIQLTLEHQEHITSYFYQNLESIIWKMSISCSVGLNTSRFRNLDRERSLPD